MGTQTPQRMAGSGQQPHAAPGQLPAVKTPSSQGSSKHRRRLKVQRAAESAASSQTTLSYALALSPAASERAAAGSDAAAQLPLTATSSAQEAVVAPVADAIVSLHAGQQLPAAARGLEAGQNLPAAEQDLVALFPAAAALTEAEDTDLLLHEMTPDAEEAEAAPKGHAAQLWPPSRSPSIGRQEQPSLLLCMPTVPYAAPRISSNHPSHPDWPKLIQLIQNHSASICFVSTPFSLNA